MDLNLKSVLFLIIASVLILFAVSPFYEFPLQDDWSYYTDIKDYLATGNISIWKFTTSNYVLQMLYGAAFAKIFGLSHVTLRLSVMLLSVLGVIGIYFLLKQLKFKEEYCIFGALFLLVNPIYYNLSHTFMTDVPFLVLTIYALLFYIKGINDGSDKFLLLGSVFSIMSFLIRQYGILTPLAVLIYYRTYRKTEMLNLDKISIFTIPFILFAFSIYWFSPGRYFSKENLYLGLHSYLPWTILYFGLFLFPLSILYILNWKKILINKKRSYITLLLISIGIVFYIHEVLTKTANNTGTWFSKNTYNALPQIGNMINTVGLGPILTEGYREKMLPDMAWILITILSAIVVIFLVVFIENKYSITKKIKLCKTAGKEMPLMYFFGLAYSLILFRSGMVDRYLIIFLPFLIAIFLESIEGFKFVRLLLVISLLIFGFWSIVYTDDYMKTNNARWNGVNYLLGKGIAPEEINGGMEFGGLYMREHVEEYLEDAVKNPSKDKTFEKAFYYPNATYIVSLSKLDNYSIDKEVPYTTLFGKNKTYILKRNNGR